MTVEIMVDTLISDNPFDLAVEVEYLYRLSVLNRGEDHPDAVALDSTCNTVCYQYHIDRAAVQKKCDEGYVAEIDYTGGTAH